MDAETKVILKLDLKNLTEEQQEYLHKLRGIAQRILMGKQLVDRKSKRKLNEHVCPREYKYLVEYS